MGQTLIQRWTDARAWIAMILADRSFTPATKRVATVLHSMVFEHGDRCPPMRQIGFHAWCCRMTVWRAIRALRSRDLLSWQERWWIVAPGQVAIQTSHRYLPLLPWTGDIGTIRPEPPKRSKSLFVLDVTPSTVHLFNGRTAAIRSIIHSFTHRIIQKFVNGSEIQLPRQRPPGAATRDRDWLAVVRETRNA